MVEQNEKDDEGAQMVEARIASACLRKGNGLAPAEKRFAGS
jgi:hypothetical protein